MDTRASHKVGRIEHYGQRGMPRNAVDPMWQTIAVQAHRHQPDAANISPREYFDRQIARTVPLGRSQTPTDIGHAVAFFASDDASEITGQALNVTVDQDELMQARALPEL